MLIPFRSLTTTDESMFGCVNESEDALKLLCFSGATTLELFVIDEEEDDLNVLLSR